MLIKMFPIFKTCTFIILISILSPLIPPIFCNVSITVAKMNHIKLLESSENQQILVVPNVVTQVGLTCRGNCPVQWYLDSYRFSEFPDDLADSIEFYSVRTFSDIDNISSYSFEADLQLSGNSNKLTGKYNCCCGTNCPKSVFVYWEGSSGTVLLQGGESSTINVYADSTNFQLNCGTSKPNVSIYLFHNQIRIVPGRNNIILQNIDGFLIPISALQKNLTHQFICSLKPVLNRRNNVEIAKFNVQFVTHTPKEPTRLWSFDTQAADSGGLVNYDYDRHILICCSESGTHRQVGYYCGTHQHCAYNQNRIKYGVRTNVQGGNGSCTWYDEGFDASNGAVVFLCETEDNSAGAEKFYGLDSISYHSISKAKEEIWNVLHMSIIAPNITQTELIYKDEVVILRCRYSSYLFSDGLQWMLTSEDGRQNLLTEELTELHGNSSHKVFKVWKEGNNENYVQWVFQSVGIFEVACLAPVYNSFEWWNSTMKIDVQDSIPPIFSKGSFKEELFVPEEGTIIALECLAEGNPVPNIQWIKAGKNLTTNSTTTTEQIEGAVGIPVFKTKSKLMFQFSSTEGGSYICEANSRVGNRIRKTFLVRKEEKINLTLVLVSVGVAATLLFILCMAMYKIREQRKVINYLSAKEIEEFEKGSPEALEKLMRNSKNEYSTNASHHLLPYNSEFEIEKDQLIVDVTNILGQGAYGMVVRGKLIRDNSSPTRIVAVKTVRPNEDVSNFKMLLAEVKIMAYIGSHENIVSLVGAYTRNIRNHELLLATEFCSNGDLLQVLRSARGHFHNLNEMSEDSGNYQNAPIFLPEEEVGYGPSRTFSSKDLLRWSHEIGKGMEYLSSKRVIHGDLAARNVLINDSFKAKVGDFGLSKHIFQYSTYQKKTVTALPWKWMAVESLKDLVFSQGSDVWALGVTMWEIFTLGQSPYPGLTWDGEFIKKLEGNYRLQKPEYASKQVYEVMLQTWFTEVKRRPLFQELVTILYQLRVDLEGRKS